MRVNSLTTRFLLVLLLCTAVPFLVFGLYVRGEVRDREEQQGTVYLPRWADDAARKIAAKLENARRVGSILAADAETYLRTEGALQAYEENIDSLSTVNPDFDMVILADSSGKVLQVTRNPRLDAERQDELELLAPKVVNEYPWFRAIRDEVAVRWEPRHFSPFLHRNPDQKTMDPTNYSLGLAIQVMDKGGNYGALFILLRWQTIQELLDETTTFLRDKAGLASANAFACDSEGTVLAHSDRRQDGKKLSPKVLRETILASENGHVFFTADDGEDHGLGFAGVRQHLLGAYQWRVGLYAPVSELFEVTRDFGRWLLFIIPSIALLLAVLAVFSSRAIVRPLRLLSEATRRVALGDLNARVEARGGDELADLGRAFNTMAGDLATSREQLRDAERQAAWAEMARQVAHEIKNPLTPMRMGAQMLLRARRDDESRWKDLSERLARNVLQQTEALDRIASDFRQFAGSPAREVKIMKADVLLAGVEELLASMSESSEVALSFEASAGDAEVAVDVQEMRRVFLNLIHNAMQACSDRGTVIVRSTVASGAVEFRVEDDGAGIPEEMRDRLFDPYFTTKTSGTGLGLAISRRIVEANGGDIKLESSGPPRTVFLVTIPLADGPSA